MDGQILQTPLHAAHVALNARIVPFAGYDLPVQYQSVIAEARAVRTHVGMFDVSHMARLWLKGEMVTEYLELITTNDVSKLSDGKGQYSLLPNHQGGTVDDIILYRITPTLYRMVVNAANHQKDLDWLVQQNSFGVEILDETPSTAMIAVQGPKAVEVLLSLTDKPAELLNAGMFGVVDCTIAGVKCLAPRSGYTGEDGFELICAATDAEKLWKALLSKGVVPCGLGARDVLRVEAGLPLYGHELNDNLSPIASGLGWVVSKTKAFIGSELINKARAEGTPRKLQGIQMHSKRLPAPGMPVYVNNQTVGEVTSGVFSPMLDCGIGFALIDSSIPLETGCEIDIRGKRESGAIVSKRFHKRPKT